MFDAGAPWVSSIRYGGEGKRLHEINRSVLPAITLLALCPAATARAQGLASPFGTVSQRVDSTTITVEYYRPSVRGRSIFGALVRWGATWTPGANWATTLELDHDVSVEGRPLPRGKYSVWMIPAQRPDSWTVILSRSVRRFHTQHPDQADDQLRLRLPVDSAPHLELLTFSFPVVSHSGATLEFHWAATVLPIRIEFGPARPALAAAHPWSSYTGVYELRSADDPRAPASRYEIVERANALWVRATADAVEPGLDVEFDLAPAGGDNFHQRQYRNGKLVGTEMDELVTFRLDSNRATAFEVHGIAEAKLLARGTRARP
jgi:Protein of unknown function (DUF2911)